MYCDLLRHTEYRITPAQIDAMTLEQIALYTADEDPDWFASQSNARKGVDAWREDEAKSLGMSLPAYLAAVDEAIKVSGEGFDYGEWKKRVKG